MLQIQNLERTVLLSHPLKKIPGCLSLSRVLLRHGIQALDSLIILQKFFLALNLCNKLLLRRKDMLRGNHSGEVSDSDSDSESDSESCSDSDLHNECKSRYEHSSEKFGNSLGISVTSYIFRSSLFKTSLAKYL